MTVAMQAALLQMDDSALSLEHLDALSRAIPDDTERRDIQSFLQVRPCLEDFGKMSLGCWSPTHLHAFPSWEICCREAVRMAGNIEE